MQTIINISAIALGGAIGAVLRLFVSNFFFIRFGMVFPIGTLIVNILGSALMGYVWALTTSRYPMSEAMRGFLMVGIFGAFTTFSTFAVDTLELLYQQNILLATANVLGNVLLCILAAWLGMLLASAGVKSPLPLI